MQREVISRRDLERITSATSAVAHAEAYETQDVLDGERHLTGEDRPRVKIDRNKLSKLVQGEPQPDRYSARLLKYIPSEVIALYITLDALVRPKAGSPQQLLYWLVFAFGVVATPIYLRRVQRVTKLSQLTISTLAFVVWVLAVGGPFTQLKYYDPLYGAVLLPIYTFSIALWEA
jgi:hypothetical protein